MVGLKTNTGRIRSLNEDYAGFHEDYDYKLYVVADGMGGHNAGEVASKLAVESVINRIREESSLDNALEKAVLYANDRIYELSMKDKKYGGMGTTLTACLVRQNVIDIANVGDSGCFGINKDKIIKLTKDHSLVQELIDSGSLTEEEGRNHPKKNIITRALGTDKNLKVDIFRVKTGEYNNFLLCSDGLTNEVTKDDILKIVVNSDDLTQASSNLVSLANERGGRDNITVLLFGGEV